MSQRRKITDENPLGWTEWGDDHDRLVEVAKTLDPAIYSGVSLDRCCGSQLQPRYASEDIHGSPIQVYPAGPDDSPYPFDLGKRLKTLGFTVLFFAGWPRWASGFEAIRAATALGFEVVVDSSGGATNGHLVDKFGGIVEPYPMPKRTPLWIGEQVKTYSMAARAKALERLGILPSVTHVKFNGNEDGNSFFDADEVDRYLAAGHFVHVPIRFA